MKSYNQGNEYPGCQTYRRLWETHRSGGVNNYVTRLIFPQLDRVKTKYRLNLSCGEPESGYFRKSGEKGTVELTVWGAKVVLLQNVNHQIAHSEGFPSKIEKLSEGERTNPIESSPEGEAFFLSWVRRATKFFWRLTYSEEEKKTEREKKGVTVRPQTWPSSKTRSAMYRSQ